MTFLSGGTLGLFLGFSFISLWDGVEIIASAIPASKKFLEKMFNHAWSIIKKYTFMVFCVSGKQIMDKERSQIFYGLPQTGCLHLHMQMEWVQPELNWIDLFCISKILNLKEGRLNLLAGTSLAATGSFTVHLPIFFLVGFRWDGNQGPEMGGMDPTCRHPKPRPTNPRDFFDTSLLLYRKGMTTNHDSVNFWDSGRKSETFISYLPASYSCCPCAA